MTKEKSCGFCSKIYPDDDVSDIAFGRGKYSNFDIVNFITIDNEGKYYINAMAGDPYEVGFLVDVKFCPCCGRKLRESEA